MERPYKLGWTEDDKQRAATELINARQNLKLLGPNARKSDIDRVERAKAAYRKKTGRNP
jgi:hypothetical protein